MERVGYLTPEKLTKMGIESPYLNTLVAEEESYPAIPESKPASTGPSAAEANALKCFLRYPRRSIFWQLTISMETDEACNLAVRFIETRRQEIYNEKMKNLKKILENWSVYKWEDSDVGTIL